MWYDTEPEKPETPTAAPPPSAWARIERLAEEGDVLSTRIAFAWQSGKVPPAEVVSRLGAITDAIDDAARDAGWADWPDCLRLPPPPVVRHLPLRGAL